MVEGERFEDEKMMMDVGFVFGWGGRLKEAHTGGSWERRQRRWGRRKRPDVVCRAFRDVSSVEESLGQFFCRTGVQLQVPEVQRPYSWQREQVETLLVDMLERFAANKAGYSLSRICTMTIDGWDTVKDEARMGQGDEAGMVVETEVQEILDGQQRLVTISLIFSAMFVRFVELNVTDQVLDEVLAMLCFRDLTSFQEASTSELRARISLHNEADSEELARFAVDVPRCANTHREEFRREGANPQFAVVDSILPGSIVSRESLLEENFRIIYDFLRNSEVLQSAAKLWQFFRFIRDKTFIVREHIKTSSLASGFDYFFKINARGMQLNYTDEMKALLLIESGYNRTTRRARARQWEEYHSRLNQRRFRHHRLTYGDDSGSASNTNFGLLFEHIYLVELGRDLLERPGAAELDVEDLNWDERSITTFLSSRTIGEPPAGKRERAQNFISRKFPAYAKAMEEILSGFGFLDEDWPTKAAELEEPFRLRAQVCSLMLSMIDEVLLDRRMPFKRNTDGRKELGWVPVLLAYLTSNPDASVRQKAEILSLLELLHVSAWMLDERRVDRFSSQYVRALNCVLRLGDQHDRVTEALEQMVGDDAQRLLELASNLRHRTLFDRERARYFLVRAELSRHLRSSGSVEVAGELMRSLWTGKVFWEKVHVDHLLLLRAQDRREWSEREIASDGAKLGALALIDSGGAFVGIENGIDHEKRELGEGGISSPLLYLLSPEMGGRTFTHADFVTRQVALLNDLELGWSLAVFREKVSGRKE